MYSKIISILWKRNLTNFTAEQNQNNDDHIEKLRFRTYKATLKLN